MNWTIHSGSELYIFIGQSCFGCIYQFCWEAKFFHNLKQSCPVYEVVCLLEAYKKLVYSYLVLPLIFPLFSDPLMAINVNHNESVKNLIFSSCCLQHIPTLTCQHGGSALKPLCSLPGRWKMNTWVRVYHKIDKTILLPFLVFFLLNVVFQIHNFSNKLGRIL